MQQQLILTCATPVSGRRFPAIPAIDRLGPSTATWTILLLPVLSGLAYWFILLHDVDSCSQLKQTYETILSSHVASITANVWPRRRNKGAD
ncbi:unnamed protein product [Heligmosomoides polygyrus]|uniref:Uncharacterized protein n=1 Tax=Heligmosomoides polygyrus TaxID=6339 RepID=A0A183FEM5_HELPZ|nr:unnamed protein product [Heligmosomoides polygyrus]